MFEKSKHALNVTRITALKHVANNRVDDKKNI